MEAKAMRLVMAVVLVAGLSAPGLAAESESASARDNGAIASWGALLDSLGDDPAMAEARAAFVRQARETAAKPIVQRVYALEDVGVKGRTWLDGRSNALEDEIRETFALAMSDHGASGACASELPQLAAAYRLTGEAVFRDRVLAQLEEMATWVPLQRPGWTLYTPGHRLPADGKDGNWLATGQGVRAIVLTLELMPEHAVPGALRARLYALLEAEIAGVTDDWQTKRPWFVRGDNPITNQWVLPTEGLVSACLAVGKDRFPDAYELGVGNLLKALDAHGANGEFEEGVGYASFTVTSMLHAAHAMAVHGDRRALEHPFLSRFPTWLIHHLQPGDMLINCFDAGPAYGAADRIRPLLSLLAVCTGSAEARWALTCQVGGPSDDLPGLAARALPSAETVQPPLFAYYERATRVNWRSSWNDGATGVWVRGGHPTDQHDHQDRGHVNFIAHGKPVLIEAGTPAYHHPLMMTHYTTGAGHNVLQLGAVFPESNAEAGQLVQLPGWQKNGGVAPITVQRLDDSGGDVTVDGTACYEGLEIWRRHVAWDAERLVVNDEVALAGETRDIILFRWHLGTKDRAVIDGEGTSFSVSWPGAALSFEGSAPLVLELLPMPDNTLEGHTGEAEPGNYHTCIVVKTAQPCTAFSLDTEAIAQPSG